MLWLRGLAEGRHLSEWYLLAAALLLFGLLGNIPSQTPNRRRPILQNWFPLQPFPVRGWAFVYCAAVAWRGIRSRHAEEHLGNASRSRSSVAPAFFRGDSDTRPRPLCCALRVSRRRATLADSRSSPFRCRLRHNDWSSPPSAGSAADGRRGICRDCSACHPTIICLCAFLYCHRAFPLLTCQPFTAACSRTDSAPRDRYSSVPRGAPFH